jgi:hypothetical protein
MGMAQQKKTATALYEAGRLVMGIHFGLVLTRTTCNWQMQPCC